MKAAMKWATVCAVAVLLLWGCAQALDGKTGETGPLAGKIINQPFTFKSGYATLASNKWTVYLWSSNAAEVPDATDPTYPNLSFKIAETSGVQSYALNLSGGLVLTGMVSGSDGTFFDSGTLKITKLDTGAGVIEGWISNGATNEGTSSLNGTFTATIRNN